MAYKTHSAYNTCVTSQEHKYTHFFYTYKQPVDLQLVGLAGACSSPTTAKPQVVIPSIYTVAKKQTSISNLWASPIGDQEYAMQRMLYGVIGATPVLCKCMGLHLAAYDGPRSWDIVGVSLLQSFSVTLHHASLHQYIATGHLVQTAWQQSIPPHGRPGRRVGWRGTPG